MIVNILRSIGAGLLALLAAFVLVVAVEGVWAILYPFAPGADTSDMATVCEHIRQLPADAFLIGSAGWAITTFAAAWIATRLGTARHVAHGFVVGGLLLAAALFNMSMLPYPALFWAVNLIALPAGILLGAWLGRAPAAAVSHSG
jgi:hypothetical protein